MDTNKLKSIAKQVLVDESNAVAELGTRIDDSFVRACEIILACNGRVIVTGMGKSGHIGGKIASTLASTGTPAFFVHPGEASHGDLGMITAKDVVLALSNSGETHELLTILPLIKRLAIPLIAMTGKPNSSLGEKSDVHINVGIEVEACPHNLAPTSSTTAALAMGDALAVALLQSRGFTAEDFARSHPGGALGKRLLLHVSDIMHSGEQLPAVMPDVSLAEALLEMTSKGLGMTAVVDDKHNILGIYTDGDLRRSLNNAVNPQTVRIESLMTKNCKTIRANVLAAEAVSIMEKDKINSLLVADQDNKLIGALNMHDLLRAGVV